MPKVNNPAPTTPPLPPHRAKKADRAPPRKKKCRMVKKKCHMFKKGRCPNGENCPYAHAKVGGNCRTHRHHRRRVHHTRRRHNRRRVHRTHRRCRRRVHRTHRRTSRSLKKR